MGVAVGVIGMIALQRVELRKNSPREEVATRSDDCIEAPAKEKPHQDVAATTQTFSAYPYPARYPFACTGRLLEKDELPRTPEKITGLRDFKDPPPDFWPPGVVRFSETPPLLWGDRPLSRSDEDATINTPPEKTDRPDCVYVNAKQFNRILKRRQQRQFIDELLWRPPRVDIRAQPIESQSTTE